jgi:hypothetical protein
MARGLSSVEHVISMKAGMSKKRQAAAEKLTSILDEVPRASSPPQAATSAKDSTIQDSTRCLS